MHVSINQSWQECNVTQIEDSRSRRDVNRRTRFDDFFILHQHFAGCEYFPAFDVKQPRGTQHHRVRGRRRRLGP